MRDRETTDEGRRQARDRRMLDLARRGVSLRDIGREVGVSYELVRIRLNAMGFGSSARRAVKSDLRRAHEEGTSAVRVAEAAAYARTHRCAVCGVGLAPRRRVTCSHRCAVIWPAVRHRTEAGRERHRRAVAQSILRHRSQRPKAQVAWAERLLAHPEALPQNRTFSIPGSRASRLARAYGFIEGQLERAADNDKEGA